jgi:hypothetical protein
MRRNNNIFRSNGLSSGEDQTLEALYAYKDTSGKKYEEVLGQLKVISYDKQRIKLYIVPAGEPKTYNQIEIINSINRIYSQAVVEWDVEWQRSYTADGCDIKDKTFDDSDKDNRMDYTPAMKALIKDYKKNNEIDKSGVYVFLINLPHKTDLQGYMPFNKQFAFIFTSNISDDKLIARDIAHEIAHGTFDLHHTFSSKNTYTLPEGQTDNLMDYPSSTPATATFLNKYQWDLIHYPGWHIGWFDKEEDAAMIATTDKDSISIKFDKVNFDFAPGFGNIEISYLLGKQTMSIIKKYPNEKFNLNVAIVNKAGKFIYRKTEVPKEHGNFIWDGVDPIKKDTIKIEDGPYKLVITLIGGEEKGWFDDWQSFKDKLYTKIKSDSVFQIATSIDTTFNINPIRIEWLEHKDMQKYVANYDYYVKLHDIYMNYEGIKKAGSPFEYLKNNTKEVEFLGKKIRVHNEFAVVLQNVEETLKKQGVYYTLKEKYKNSSQTLSMREINDPKGKGKISEHGFGLAVDILPKKNPQIHENSALIRYFIEKSTGFDVGEKKTTEQIKNAHDKFMSLYANTNINQITTKYKAINDYNNDTSTLKITELQSFNNQLNNLQQSLNNVLNTQDSNDSINKKTLLSLIEKGLSSNLTRVNKLIAILDNYENTLIFSDVSKIQLNYLVGLLNQIKEQHSLFLQKITDLQDTAKSMYVAFDSFIQVDISKISAFQSEINTFQTDIDNIKKANSKKYSYKNLYEYAKALENEINNIGFGNVLFKDGFCDIEFDIINAFLDADSRIQWGGNFTDKIDGMHFGFKTQYVTDIIK